MIELIETTETEEVTPESTRIDGVLGYPFRLGDGREWALARPSIRIRPRFTRLPANVELGQLVAPGNARVEVEVDQVWDYPPGPRKKVQALLDACVSGASLRLDLIVDAAFDLVRLCHRIEAEHAASLFDLSFEQVEDLAVGMLRMFRGFSPTAKLPEEPDLKPEESES